MQARQLVRDGNLQAALTALQEAVRKDASNARERVFLFQLLTVMGQWSRALNQLNVAAQLDSGTLPMAQTYREAIQCEALRADIFSGKRAPLIFGEPQPWLAQMLEALRHDAIDRERAMTMRAQALEAAPASSGTINGEPFAWLADADQRLGPVLEAIVNGRYFWIPFDRISRIDIEAPADLRDTVWTAASFTWVNGAQNVGLIPTRYAGTVESGDDGLLLARRTEWIADGPRVGQGLGQRMLATDRDDYALLDVRSIILNPPAGDSADATENG